MRIGETFINEGLISRDQLKKALLEQEKTHDRLGDIVLKMGYVTSDQIGPILAKYFDIPFFNVKENFKDITSETLDTVTFELAKRFNLIPVAIKDNTLTIAIADPLDLSAVDTIRLKTGRKVECVLSPAADIQEAIEYCYQHNLSRMQRNVEQFINLEDVEEGEPITDESSGMAFGATDQPVVQYVKSLIVQGINNRASDIHLQPKEDKADLRFRIDGILYDFAPPPKTMLAAITTRIKILSGLDIAEKRLPQDGRFKVKISQNEVDLRVSCFPTIYGESVVMRLLNTSSPLKKIEELGMYTEDLARYRELIIRPYGLILVTGPTGSGKTTTLYTTLNEIKSSDKNIITLEDPVEYRLPFIQQSQVNTAIGFDFAKGLRSILRQDPDIIMVGEIRDQETAEIAIHAALTGHLVFATLRTNDAAGAAVRLIKMGVEPFLITSSLLGVVAQRLIRTICSNCKSEHAAEKSYTQKLAQHGEIKKYYKGKGCKKCYNSGYSGRKGIYEVLIPDAKARELILEQRSAEEVRAAAQNNGMRTLRQIAIENLKNGETTIEEILRITQETEDT